MDIQELISLFTNAGVSVGCLVYFMWYNAKYSEKMNSLMSELKVLMEEILRREKEDK